jgi:hypothetical protein
MQDNNKTKVEKQLKIIQQSENEYWVGSNRTALIEGNIIFVIAEGEQTPELARLQEKTNSKLSALAGGKIKYLIDLNHCGKNSPEARVVWKKLSDDLNTQKVAVFGLHPVARVLASFVLGLSPASKDRFFKTKEKALEWLKE